MDKLFDDIARTLARPIPRRRALRSIVSGVAGAVFVAFGLEREAFACASGETLCGNNPNGSQRCCTPSQYCCGNAACCSNSVVCCAGKCCQVGYACVMNKCTK